MAKALQRLWEGFGRYPVIAWQCFTEALGKLWEVSRISLAKLHRGFGGWLRLYRGFGRYPVIDGPSLWRGLGRYPAIQALQRLDGLPKLL